MSKLKHYLVIYFYTTDDNNQGWGSVGPVSFLDDLPTVPELKDVQDRIIYENPGVSSVLILNTIEVKVD